MVLLIEIQTLFQVITLEIVEENDHRDLV